MSTRTARFDDHWRRALARDYPVQYSSFSFKGLRCLQDGVITFAKGITAIVGGNGAGKSTLAQAIVDVLAGVDGVHDLSHLALRLIGGELHASVVSGKSVRELSLFICPDGDRKGDGSPLLGEFAWLDSSDMAVLCQRQFQNDPAFDDLLESIGPRDFDECQLGFASYIVGKDYTQCTVWEIQDYELFDVFPYFRVTCGGTTYGSQDMGLGEFALLLSLWTLNRVSINSIVVLEEPETHISSRSQNALMDLVAWACDRRGLWVVITTHSPVVLQRIPKENIRLLVSNGSKSKVVPAPHWHQIASIVGGGVAYRNLLLVEDEFAEHFAQVLLEQLDIDLKRQAAFAVMKGYSQITTILCTLPLIENWSKIVGVYDGDMQGKLNSDGFHWPHIFLPGTLAPERLLRDVALAKTGATSLAEILHCDFHCVEVALNSAAGLDHHDWVNQVVLALGFDRTVVITGLVRVWLKENINEAREFTDKLRQVIG